MLKKRMNKKGFTLAELLVVVAIIAILVAVSIPIFTGKLESSREKTDIANMRAAKAAAVTAYLDDDWDTTIWTKGTSAYTAYYNAEDGVMQSAAPTTGYGEGTATDGKTTYKGYTSTTAYTDKVIKVSIAIADGKVTLTWE